jgi:predicted DNA-binding protein (MmcQ/YjbR family)
MTLNLPVVNGCSPRTLDGVRPTFYPHWTWIYEHVEGLPSARAADQEAWGCVVLWIGDKMFGMVGEDGRGRELLTVKLPPEDGQALRQQHDFIEPGWHLNKRHWSSVVLSDGGKDRQLITELLDDSYACLLDTLPRWRQHQIRMMT